MALQVSLHQPTGSVGTSGSLQTHAMLSLDYLCGGSCWRIQEDSSLVSSREPLGFPSRGASSGCQPPLGRMGSGTLVQVDICRHLAIQWGVGGTGSSPGSRCLSTLGRDGLGKSTETRIRLGVSHWRSSFSFLPRLGPECRGVGGIRLSRGSHRLGQSAWAGFS